MSGELLSLVVAVSWTISALLSETASRRMGEAVTNVYRMTLALILLGGMLIFTGQTHLLTEASAETWGWLLASGLVGYTFGDYCLFNAYNLIGSRFAQLFMTLASPFAAITAWIMMGERLTFFALIGMILTLSGISMAIMNRSGDDGKRRHIGIKLPMRGVVLGIGAALGQGVGLVLSKQGLTTMGDDASMAAAAGTMMRGVAGLAGFIVLLFIRRKQDGMATALTASNMTLLTCTAIFGPAVGVSLSLRAAQLTSVGVAQTIMALSPVLILLPAHFIYHQKVTAIEVVGAIVSFVGVAMFFV